MPLTRNHYVFLFLQAKFPHTYKTGTKKKIVYHNTNINTNNEYCTCIAYYSIIPVLLFEVHHCNSINLNNNSLHDTERGGVKWNRQLSLNVSCGIKLGVFEFEMKTRRNNSKKKKLYVTSRWLFYIKIELSTFDIMKILFSESGRQ